MATTARLLKRTREHEPRLERERDTVGSAASEDLIGRITKGAFAGAAALLAMDYVGWRLYLNESDKAYRQEKRAQIGGKWVPQATAEKMARPLGLRRSRRFALGTLAHFGLGAAAGAAYALLSKRFPQIRRGRGLLYGLGLFLIQDELMTPLMGVASRPADYPWQAHARGLIDHLVMGAALEAGYETLNLP